LDSAVQCSDVIGYGETSNAWVIIA